MSDALPDRRTMLCALALGLATLAFITAKTGRDALFFQGSSGLLQLPLIYINIAAAALPLAMIFVKAMKLWGARPARIGILSLAGSVMAAVAPFLTPGDNTAMLAMFMFIPAVFGLVLASLWLLAADLFETVEKRLAASAFSKIGAGALAGGMCGGLVAKALSGYLDPKWLIFLGAMILFAAVFLVAHIHRRFPSNSRSTKGEKRNFLAPFKQRYSLILLFVSMTGALAGILIDFQFYAAAAGSNMGPKGNASFFANFYILLNFSSLLLQLFATPKIQNKIGLRGGLMVLPLALTGGATFATAAATALSRSLLRVTEGGLRSSVHRSIWEQAFIPIDAADRSTVKLLVDGIAARVAEAIGAALILLWFSHKVASEKIEMPLDTRWISWIILATAVSWVLITRALRAQTVDAEKPTHTVQDIVDCERFPDQCPCTTELGKGVP